jgi:predicted nuclease with TOPRIM domain
MRLPTKEVPIKEEKDLTCTLNYEAEYNRLNEEFKKLKADRDYLQEELKATDRELIWHRGFRTAVENIFGKQNNRG